MPAPQIFALSASPSRSDPANFNSKSEAFFAGLSGFRDQCNALAAYFNGLEVATDADHGSYYNPSLNENIDDAKAGDRGLYSTSGPGAWPVGSGTFVFVRTFAIFSSEAKVQMAHSYHSSVITEPKMWVRSMDNAGNGWSRWVSLMTEYGSNANGDYVRFPDGTQICSHKINDVGAVDTASGGAFRSPLITWAAFPAAFVGVTPRVIWSPSDVAEGQWMASGGGAVNLTNPGNSYLMGTVSNAGTTNDVTVVATGRWF